MHTCVRVPQSRRRVRQLARKAFGDEQPRFHATTQEGLGLAAEMHRNYVGAIERGEINPSFALLMRLSHGLELPVSELMVRYEAEAARREQASRRA